MLLPGRLQSTSLGDLLGTLHRARAHGSLELVETRGRTHRIHVSEGMVVGVELDAASGSLAEVLRKESAVDDETLRRSLLRAIASGRLHGEVLVREFSVPEHVVHAALRRQLVHRLNVIENVRDAQVFFRVAVRPPPDALFASPLGPDEFLRGRRRARDRGPFRTASRASSEDPSRVRALRTLGLLPGSDAEEIKKAYRRLVRMLHPDLNPGVTAEEQQRLRTQLVEVTAAYQTLVA